MRQIIITRHGGPEVLQIKEVKDPEPGPGEVRIRVKAAGINFADIMARQGLYPEAPKPPGTVGYEASGIIDMVGQGIDKSWIDKPVMTLTKFEGYADMIVVPKIQVFEKPASLSFEQACAIPVNYLTAYQLVAVSGGLHKSEAVLIHNAGGGVGLAALDIARHIGAVTYGTASARKHDFLKERGLDHAIDYRTKDWFQELKKLTEGKGVELIIDPLGGDNWALSYRSLRATGRLGLFGMSTATKSRLWGKLRLVQAAFKMTSYHPLSLLNKNRGVFGVNLGHMWHEPEKIHLWMDDLLEGVESGWVRPHLDNSFPFEEAAAAHHYIESRKNIGKVVLTP